MGDADWNGAGIRPGGGLDGLLDELVDKVPGVRHAVLLSTAGVVAGSSRGLSRADARHLASVASGFHRVATDAGRRLGAGSGRRTLVELDAGGGCSSPPRAGTAVSPCWGRGRPIRAW